jgi:hypothetical protein
MMQEEYNARDKTSKKAQKRLQQSRQFKAVGVWGAALCCGTMNCHTVRAQPLALLKRKQ